MSIVQSVVSASGSTELIKFDDDSTVQAAKGREFVDSVIAHAGSDKSVPRKEYQAFRKMYWEEPIYNAALFNPFKISYEQQFGEMAAHWSRSGKKFSDEPRISKGALFEAPGGPTRPEEFAHISEKPIPYWGHERAIDPFRVARFTARPLPKTVGRKKMTKIEETAHLGPGIYKLHDPWLDSQQRVCGRVQQTSSFKSQTQRCGILPAKSRVPEPRTPAVRNLFQRPASKPKRMEEESSIVTLETGTRKSTAVNELYPSREALSFANSPSGLDSNALAGGNAPDEIPSEEQLLAGYLQYGSLDGGEQDPNMTKQNMVGFNFEVDNSYSRNSIPHSPEKGYHAPEPVEDSMNVLSPVPARPASPGFKFLKGQLGPSALDVVTGTTQADISFRRVELSTGGPLIVPVSIHPRHCMLHNFMTCDLYHFRYLLPISSCPQDPSSLLLGALWLVV